jgi:hypothetical protein
MIPDNNKEAVKTNLVKIKPMIESTEKEADQHEHQPYLTPDSDGEEDVIHGQQDKIAEVTSKVTATTLEIPSIRVDLDPTNIVEGSHTRKPSSRAQGFVVYFKPRVCFEPGVNMAFTILQTTKNQRYHCNDLPLEPKNWQEMIQMLNPYAEGFKAAT